MTGENTGPVGAGAAASRSTSFMTVHTMPAEGAGAKQGHGDLGAVPVMVFAPAPPWTARAGRRPVVAVLDSGGESHSWLTGSPGDPVVRHASEFDWSKQPSPTPEGFLDPFTLPGSFRGHATFIAGVIRQTAPAARILSVPVMNADGAVDPGKALCALKWLRDKMVVSGKADRFVDVICLAFGYEDEDEDDGQADDRQTEDLRGALQELANQGVLIVASAGNRGETKPRTYPAAFALHADLADPPVISVGAHNPDGKTVSHYSNYGDWVTYQAIGSGVISTFAHYNGHQTAAPVPDFYPHPFRPSSTIDPDDFNSGFARWSGTSFSAARIAGLLAHELSSAPDLGDLSPAAAARRAKAALAAIEANRWRAWP
jgi:Subtilase family